MSEAEGIWGNMNDLPKEKPASGVVFHYTSAEVGIFNILGSGTLRMSPMNTMNDPWESEPFQPSFAVPEDEDRMKFTREIAHDAWAEIDRDIRLHTKMVSLTRDWGYRSTTEAGPGPGWGHLSSWAHYGARQAGICLGFNLDALLEQFHKVGGADAHRVHGPVRYWEFEHEQYLESVPSHYPLHYGTDAIARHYAEQYGDLIFLSKHSDWSSEYEYRLALMNKSTLPAYIDIRPALAGIVVGSRFPDGLRAALFEVLADYDGIEAAQIYQSNRRSMVIPYEARAGYGGSKFTPIVDGTLSERVARLRHEQTLTGRGRKG